MEINHKVFCIGFHKTGTTSLKYFLEELGYKVTGPNFQKNKEEVEKIKNGNLENIHNLVDKFDAFQDNPWPLLYRELDSKYPNSKFILSFREPDSWFRSACRYFGDGVTPMRKYIYGANAGCPVGNENIYIKRYLQHNTEALDYFKDRRKDFLVFSLESSGKAHRVSKFLGIDPGRARFPHYNQT